MLSRPRSIFPSESCKLTFRDASTALQSTVASHQPGLTLPTQPGARSRIVSWWTCGVPKSSQWLTPVAPAATSDARVCQF